MSVKKLKQIILRVLGLLVLKFGLNVLLKTVRIKIENYSAVKNLIDKKQNFVVGFWHGTMILGWYLHKDKNFAALVSQSKDGDLLSRLLSGWGYKVARGSSNRGGKEAMEDLLNFAVNGYSIAITPDGPREPQFKMKAGAVITAKKTGIPLVLIGVAYKGKIKLKSWDSFEIPKPFTSAAVVYCNPVYFDRNLSFDETSKKIEECENILNTLQKEAGIIC